MSQSDHSKHALPITRAENFSEWYQAVITGADLAEISSVRGCMVIKPYGFAIWELMQAILDAKFKELGHVNCYFPLLIPVDLFEREAEHVAGFAKEMAIVTHHRLEQKDGKLVPASPLETPLAIRPTSELIIGESMARWINSYRDLPVLINQWCNVMRWEMRTRMFLRTSEFLWQEGHTAHETEPEARAEEQAMHGVYRWFIRDVLKMSCICGKKPEHDRFAGAVETLTVEAMMQDGKALQAATSHYLGQNFSKAVGMQFQGRDEKMHHAYTTSWGLSTRIIGGLIMSHADDDGLNLPTAVAPYHVVFIPMLRGSEQDGDVIEYCKRVRAALPANVRAMVDVKETVSQSKKWDYVRKGVPLVCEIGGRELADEQVCVMKRASGFEKVQLGLAEFVAGVEQMLLEHDAILQRKNEEFFNDKVRDDIGSFDELKKFFAANSGFVRAKWGGSRDGLELLDEISVSIRCIPAEQTGTEGKCILSGQVASTDVILAKSY